MTGLRCRDENVEEIIQGFLAEADQRGRWLFGVACCRRIWSLLSDKRCQDAVEVVDRFATGGVQHSDLEAARICAVAVAEAAFAGWDPNWSSWSAQDNAQEFGRFAVRALTSGNIAEVARLAAEACGWAAASGHPANSSEASSATNLAVEKERSEQAKLVHNLYGPPREPRPFGPPLPDHRLAERQVASNQARDWEANALKCLRSLAQLEDARDAKYKQSLAQCEEDVRITSLEAAPDDGEQWEEDVEAASIQPRQNNNATKSQHGLGDAANT